MKHRFVLQKLGQIVRNFSSGVFYPRETFAKVSYDGCPVIYTESRPLLHPDFRDVSYGTLPAGYRVVGQIANTALDGDLQCADAIITDEALSTAMHAHPDQYGISSGFWGVIKNGVMDAITATNHVLLFPREAGRPNDAAAQVCNTRAEPVILPMQLESGFKTMTDTSTIPYPPAVQVGNAPAPEPDVAEKPTDGEQSELERLRAENEQLKALAEQLLAQLQEIRDAMQQAAAQQQAPAAATPAAPPMAVGNVAAEATAEIERLRKKCADYEWQKMEPNLPPAMRGVAGRTAYNADPLKFLQDAVSAARTAPKHAPAEGVTIAPTPAAAPETFLTPEYAGARQIGNVKPPENQIEGARIGPTMWMMYGGIKLDLSDMERR